MHVDQDILVTHTQIVSLIPAPATLAVNKLFARIMVGLLYANVLQAMLEIHMSLAGKQICELYKSMTFKKSTFNYIAH